MFKKFRVKPFHVTVLYKVVDLSGVGTVTPIGINYFLAANTGKRLQFKSHNRTNNILDPMGMV